MFLRCHFQLANGTWVNDSTYAILLQPSTIRYISSIRVMSHSVYDISQIQSLFPPSKKNVSNMSIQSESFPSNNNNNKINLKKWCVSNNPFPATTKQNQRFFLEVLLIPEVAARVDEEISITTTDDAQSMTPTPQASERSWKDGEKCVSFDGRKEPKSWTMVVLGWKKMKNIRMNEVRLIGGGIYFWRSVLR